MTSGVQDSESNLYYSVRTCFEWGLDPIPELGEYVTAISAEIIWENLDSGDCGIAGNFQGWRIHLGRNLDEQRFSVFDLFEGVSSEILEFYSALLNENGEIREEFGKFLGIGSDVLIMNMIRLFPEHRGNRLGLAVVLKILQVFGQDCALAIAKPYPFQFGSHKLISSEDDRRMRYDLFQRDGYEALQCLRNYWSELGSLPVPTFREFIYLDLGRRLPLMIKFRNC